MNDMSKRAENVFFFFKLATIKFTKKLACLIKKSQKQLVFLTNLDFIN